MTSWQKFVDVDFKHEVVTWSGKWKKKKNFVSIRRLEDREDYDKKIKKSLEKRIFLL